MCVTAFTMVSCTGAYTEISGTWTKPNYNGKKFKNILVVAISDDIVKRNSVESAVVKELGKDKINSSTSSTILDFNKIEKTKEGKFDTTKLDGVKKALSEAGYDGAIVISLLDIKEKTEYVPGQTYYQPSYYYSYGYQPYSYNGFYNYSFTTYNVVNTPGYHVTTKKIFIESRLFDIQEDNLLWASTSETLNPSNLNDFSNSYSRALVNSLLNDDVVK